MSATQNITKKRMVKNVIAARVITLGGLTILLLLAAIVWHLLRVVLPLVQSPDIDAQTEWRLPDNHKIVAVGDLDNGQPIWLSNNCSLTFGYPSVEGITLYTGEPLVTGCDESIKIVTVNREPWLFRYLSEHQVVIEKLTTSSADFTRKFIGRYALSGLDTEQSGQPLNDKAWLIKVDATDISLAVKTGEQWLLFTLAYPDLDDVLISKSAGTNPLTLASLSVDAEQLVLLPEYGQFVGLKTNTITFYDRRGGILSTQMFDTPVERISTNGSQRSVFVEMASGQLHRWTISNEQGRFVYKANTVFDINAPLSASAYSPNEQSALFLTKENELLFANMVTGEILERQPLITESGHQLDKIDGVALYQDKLYIASDTLLLTWMFYEHSPVTTRALFHRVWYEGYTQPDYIWQSTPSTHQTEVKFSLVPLIIGSLKSALLAIVVAVPLALGAAIYTAYFSPVAIRNLLKPVIEFLEAVPSVIIGFVAAGWMATMTLSTLSSLLASVLLLPIILWLFALVNYRVTRRLPKKWQRGGEWFVISMLLILLYWLTQSGIAFVDREVGLFANTFFDLNPWNNSTLVVALALGIAIVPTIYSIAEDAVYDVPMSLRQASFALGATQLQTLRKVVLVAALPSIVSAIILGFSRAFGETILVLMITGNTPIADWDLLVGLRSMTANLAIELPEAEVNSTHYRVLFLTALILFVFTFMINTVAEWIRGNVRWRYRYA